MTLADDPRVTRALEITAALTPMSPPMVAAMAEERRTILRALRAEGVNMTELAAAVGMSRQNLYAVVGPSIGERREATLARLIAEGIDPDSMSADEIRDAYPEH